MTSANALQKKPKRISCGVLDDLSTLPATPDFLARAYVSLIPQMMGSLRNHLRTLEGGDLRIGQFRMMLAIRMEENPSLSQVAEVVGLTLPSASKVVDELERRSLIRRQSDKLDRRRQNLSLTAEGMDVLEMVKRTAETHFAVLFSQLTPAERSFLLCAAETLRPLFGIRAADLAGVSSSVTGRSDKPPVAEESTEAG